MLNKRSEFISKCQHINKRLLNRVKDDSNDWLWCVFVFKVYLFVLLMKSFSFCWQKYWLKISWHETSSISHVVLSTLSINIILDGSVTSKLEQMWMRKFQCFLFVLKRSYICYYIISMTVPWSLSFEDKCRLSLISISEIRLFQLNHLKKRKSWRNLKKTKMKMVKHRQK